MGNTKGYVIDLVVVCKLMQEEHTLVVCVEKVMPYVLNIVLLVYKVDEETFRDEG